MLPWWHAPLLVAGSFLLAGCGGEPEPGEARTHVPAERDGLYYFLDNQRQDEDRFRRFLFGPGDRIVAEPDGGIDPYDPTRADPKTIGVYRLDGTEQLTIRWGDHSPTQTIPVVAAGVGPLTQYDGYTAVKAAAYEADAKLAAVYVGVFGLGKGGQDTQVAMRTLKLGKDGKFSTSIVRATEDMQSSEEASILTGRYTLVGNTLTLRFADGRETRHTVIPVGHKNDEPYVYDPVAARDRYELWYLDQRSLRRVR